MQSQYRYLIPPHRNKYVDYVLFLGKPFDETVTFFDTNTTRVDSPGKLPSFMHMMMDTYA